MPVSTVVGGGGSNPFGETVDLSEMQTIATARLLGNVSGGNAVPASLTLADVLGFLGTGTPGSGNYLRGDGSWQAVSGGKVAQVVSTFSGAMQTGTGTIPFDDTIPQNSEGTEFFTLAVTPTDASSTLLFLTVLQVATSASSNGTMAFFVDSTADAIAAFPYFINGNTPTFCSMFSVSAGSTSSRTYKLRAGQSSASTVTINGTGSARRYGGVAFSGFAIIEVLP